MSESELLGRHQSLLAALSGLPQKIISLYHLDNIAEFVLHGLCQEGCFDINQAAYFVDNPDFDCLKGIAGFSKLEIQHYGEDLWSSPEILSGFMRDSNFNQRVRSLEHYSIRRRNQDHDKIVQGLATQLQIADPGYHSWDLKHDNYGVLLYNRQGQDGLFDDHFARSLYLLGFCPIF